MLNLRRLTLFVVISLLGVLSLAGPAQAHSRLVSSDPADGAVLDQSPAAVTLAFNEELLSLGAGAELQGSAGEVPISIEVAGQNLVLSWDGPLAPSAYTLTWRVTSADGHPIAGTLTFTVDPVAGTPAPTPTAAQATPTQSPTATSATSRPSETTARATSATSSTPSETVMTTTPVSPSSSPSALNSTDQPADDAGGGNSWLWVVVAAVAALAALGGAYIWRRNRHR